MKSLILIATLAAGTSAFATSPEALMIAKISCLKGEVNTEVTTKMIGAVGSLTTEGGAMMLVMGADGKMKDGCGVISSSKKFAMVMPASGAADSACINGDQPTSLVITIVK